MQEQQYSQTPSPQQLPEQEAAPKVFYREKIIVGFLIVAAAIFVVGYVLRILTPQAPVPIQDNSWNGLTPGYSTLAQVQEKLGQPLTSQQTNLGTELAYTSKFPALPNQVVVGSENKVSFVKEHIVYDETHTLATYTEKLGEPDLVLYGEELADSVKAYVFLDEGLVIVAHIANNAVEQKWYFAPTTQETFLATWGQTLTTEEHGPEALAE